MLRINADGTCIDSTPLFNTTFRIFKLPRVHNPLEHSLRLVPKSFRKVTHPCNFPMGAIPGIDGSNLKHQLITAHKHKFPTELT